MTDNTTINSMTGGDVIASKDISGVKHQQIIPEGKATDYYPNQTEHGYTEGQVDETFIGIDPDGNVHVRGALVTDEDSLYDSFAGVALGGDWSGVTGTGQTIAVANSNCVISAGTTINAEAYIQMPIDYMPLRAQARITLSQRIANQDIYFELGNGATPGADTQFARFHFTGTTNTYTRGETQSSGDTNGNEGTATDLTISATSSAIVYTMEVVPSGVSFYADGVFLAQRVNEIPGLYNALYLRVRVKNGGSAPASNTDITIDWIKCSNVNRLDVGTMFTTEPIQVAINQNGQEVVGDKQNNTATPSATAFESLTAIANASAPTRTEGNVGALRTTLSGDLAITLDGETVGLSAGSNNIGDVDILSIAAGDNNIGNVDVASLPAGVIAGMASLPAGTNNIGDVDVLTLPAGVIAGMTSLPAGTNNIGDVDVITLPAIPAGTNNIGDVDVLTIAAGDNNIGNVDIVTLPGIAGTVAHDSPDSGNPIKIGGRADTTFQTAAADADRVDALFDVYGVQEMRTDHPNRWSYHENSSSALTDTSVQAAPGAGLSVYITDIVFSTGAATACNIFFEEGASTILGPYYLEAVAGRGLVISFRQPHKCTANTAVTVTTSAAIAHGLDVKGFIAP